MIKVQMRLSEETIQKVNSIREITGVKNRTRIVTSGVTLLNSVLSAIEKGNSVYIDDGKGKRRQITMLDV